MTNQSPLNVTRRDFLKYSSTAAAASALVFPVGVRAAASKEKARIAAVGVGGKGWSDITSTAEAADVIAFCDVESGPARRKGGFGQAAEKWPHARRYTDWRKMLDKEYKNLDGITVSTPDHMHAPVTMTAIHLGLGTYTQKPLTRTVYEARQLTLAAKKAKTVTQMGNQGHSSIAYRSVVQLVQEGAIGKIKEAHTWSNRPIWPQGIDRPQGRDEIPETLNWDLWLGVSAERPYVKDTYHDFKWRGWYDFGAGALGDMGCHIIDPVVWSLNLKAPRSVRYEGPEPKPEAFPAWEIITYKFPGTEFTANDAITVRWYDGGVKPSPRLAGLRKDESLPDNGCLLVGKKGNIVCRHGGMPMLLPEKKYADYKMPQLEEMNHYTQWSKALVGEGKTNADFDYSGPLTETVLLGTIAPRVPYKTLKWDSENLKFTNAPKANNYVHAEYRKGWEVEGLS